jgi:hypothetical protein
MRNKDKSQSEFSTFDAAMSKLVKVSKAEIDRRLADEKKARDKRKKAG